METDAQLPKYELWDYFYERYLDHQLTFKRAMDLFVAVDEVQYKTKLAVVRED